MGKIKAEATRESGRIMKQATAMRRKQKIEAYELDEINRKIKKAEAKTELALANAQKSAAEAEVWRGRRAKVGAIFGVSRGGGGKGRKSGTGVSSFFKTVGKGVKNIEDWARREDKPAQSTRRTKKRVPKKRATGRK